MEVAYYKVERTFDLLDRYRNEYADKKEALAGKEGGNWYAYSSKEYVDFTNKVSLGLLSLGVNRGDKIATVTTNRMGFESLLE